jgi:hypothetical protein
MGLAGHCPSTHPHLAMRVRASAPPATARRQRRQIDTGMVAIETI